MIDFLFSFSSDVAYSNCGVDWSSILPGKEIVIIKGDLKFSVVRNDILSYRHKFDVKDENTIIIKNSKEYSLLDGDLIQFEFKNYEAALIISILDSQGYSRGEILTLKENPCIDLHTGKPQNAKFKIIDVDENGQIINLEIISGGSYPKDIKESELVSASGNKCKIFLEMMENKPVTKNFTVLDVKRSGNIAEAILQEPIDEIFKNGEFLCSRYQLTLNKPTEENYSHAAFILVGKETPFLKIPLDQNNNVFNQAVLMIDKKIEELTENKIKDISKF